MTGGFCGYGQELFALINYITIISAMTEIFPGPCAYPDDFQARVEFVSKALDNPAFIEQINDRLIIDEHSDGQRDYSGDEIIKMGTRYLEALMEGVKLAPGSMSDVLARGLLSATDNFLSPGSFTLKGGMVCDLADYVYFEANKNNFDPARIMELVETFVAGALALGCDKAYEDYQTDISLSGQGVMPETYELNIQFRPIPKNVVVPGTGIEPARL